MYDKEYAKFIYSDYRNKPIYKALLNYNKHFQTLFPLNFVEAVTVKDLQNAIATNQELDLEDTNKVY